MSLQHITLACFACFAVPAIVASPAQGTDPKQLYTCDFKAPLAREWKLVGGQRSVEAGWLKQTQPKPADPTKAILVLGDRDELSSEVVILAKLRLDSWKNGEGARAGLSVCSDPATGHGFNLVFHQGRLEFVHDYVTWGPGVPFPYQVGRSYWMKLCRTAGLLKGKAWPEGEPEPADWMVTWPRGGEDVTGYPALVGGAGGPGDEFCTVSFASCQVLQDERWLRVHQAERALARVNEASVQSLRLAIEDLCQTHGARYARGPEYRQRLAELERTIAAARAASGPDANPEPLLTVARQFKALRTEALLANPLLDFDRLLLVKRKEARAYHPAPRFTVPPLSSAPALLNGLPLNYQGNGVLRQVPIENEIAVLSPLRPEARLTTLYHPLRPAFVGDLKLHFEADRLLFSSVGGHDRFQIFV